MTITLADFGSHAGSVIDFGGEYILPMGGVEIHPGHNGGWVVVSPTGETLCRFADLDDAVAYALAR